MEIWTITRERYKIQFAGLETNIGPYVQIWRWNLYCGMRLYWNLVSETIIFIIKLKLTIL